MSTKSYTDKQVSFLKDLYAQGLKYSEIAKKFNSKFKKKKSSDAIRKLLKRQARSISAPNTKGPKILLYDIETAPVLAYIWRLYDQNVGLNMIDKDWYVLSWAAKWLGSSEDEVMYMDQRHEKDIEDDKRILQYIWNLLDEADIVITQNGKKFDRKKLNARFLMNGMQPPSSYRNIDTLVIAKRHFGFTSNKLEYMTDKLCKKYKKLKHAKFAGFELWKQCLAGNSEAWDEMEQYNRYDVLSLEELYNILIPWDTSIDFNTYHDELEHVCSCGSTEYAKNGFYNTNTGRYQKYKCKSCGSERRGSKNLLSKEKRDSLKRGASRLR